MSVWGDNPEWFDGWLESEAISGRFGPGIQAQAERGEFEGYKEWSQLDHDGILGAEALRDYWEEIIDKGE